MMKQLSCIFFLCCYICLTALSQSNTNFTQQEVIYGRKDGMALTMVVLTPKIKTNSRGIIHVVSGGWMSTYDWMPGIILQSEQLLKRGYTVFAVMHGSQPKYTALEILPDIHRVVRFIRYHAQDYQIDADRIGMTGGSAGGHLSLMVATADARKDIEAKDLVDRVTSRIQAVACFFPATDFLNFGQVGANMLLNKPFLDKVNLHAALHFTEWDSTLKVFVPITDQKKRTQIIKQVSPIYQITPNDPPILIAHGDADEVVPLQQSELFIKKLKQSKVPCELHIKKGANHSWEEMKEEQIAFAHWFDKYLK